MGRDQTLGDKSLNLGSLENERYKDRRLDGEYQRLEDNKKQGNVGKQTSNDEKEDEQRVIIDNEEADIFMGSMVEERVSE